MMSREVRKKGGGAHVCRLCDHCQTFGAGNTMRNAAYCFAHFGIEPPSKSVRMRSDQRDFFVYDLEVAVRKDGAVIPSINTVIDVWRRMSDQNKFHFVDNDSKTILIGNIELDDRGFANILIRVSDRNSPNSVYSDPQSQTFDEHLKVGNQGSDFACHVILSMIMEIGRPNIYTCCIERVSGIPVGYIQRTLSKFLNMEFHDSLTSFSYPSPGGGLMRDGSPRIERCCPHIELRGRPSDSLINDINNGRLSGVSLVKEETKSPIDGAAYLVKETTELKLNIDKGSLPDRLWESLSEVFRRNSRNYSKAKIAVKLLGANRTVTVLIDLQTGAPLDDLYVRSFSVDSINPLLAQSTKVLVPHLLRLAIPHFLQQRAV